MLNVFVIARIKPGMRAQALACYRALVPEVLAHEPGCLEYLPSIDCDLGLPNQQTDADAIFVCERWTSIGDFQAHLRMPHTLAFRAAIQPCLAERLALRITQAAIDAPEPAAAAGNDSAQAR